MMQCENFYFHKYLKKTHLFLLLGAFVAKSIHGKRYKHRCYISFYCVCRATQTNLKKNKISWSKSTLSLGFDIKIELNFCCCTLNYFLFQFSVYFYCWARHSVSHSFSLTRTQHFERKIFATLFIMFKYLCCVFLWKGDRRALWRQAGSRKKVISAVIDAFSVHWFSVLYIAMIPLGISLSHIWHRYIWRILVSLARARRTVYWFFNKSNSYIRLH